MKYIVAIIQPDRLDEVLQKLEEKLTGKRRWPTVKSE